ncbi:MAG: IPT/TIG domain-containing protein [Bacillota bacterium]|nr:IPT/TIG domain-containing protein [Bacillota bacterium]
MFKKFTVIFTIIFMAAVWFAPSFTNAIAATNDRPSISIQIPKSFTKALGAKNKKSSISTTGITPHTSSIELNISSLTQWVLDESTNTLYAISQDNKTLYFINATTMKTEKSIIFNGSPTDIIKDSGNLYITLDDLKQIVIVDMSSRTITKTLSTFSDPYRVVKDGNILYYAERDQWCLIHAYDLVTNTDKGLDFDSIYEPDLAINTDKHILYIGESGSSGSNMIYYSTIDNKVIGRTNYDNGYGYSFPGRNTLFDGANVYYASRDFKLDNPLRCIGDFGGNVILAKNNLAFTNTSIYDAATHVKLGDYGSDMDLVEVSNSTIYLYSKATGSIKSFTSSNGLIDRSNIISLISGTPAAPIQSNTNSVLEQPHTYSLEMDSSLTQWVLDEATNTIYGISNENKALFFINATTLNLEKSITFTSEPTDIIIEKGKLYISLDDANQIAIVDMLSREITGTLYTSSDPYRIVIDGNKLYYAERDQWCDIYEYDLITNTDKTLAIDTTYYPDLAINTDKHILYIGESESTGSNMIYYSTTYNKVIGTTNYNNGNGFLTTERYTLFDGEQVYFAGRDFDPVDPTHILGSYGGDIIFAKYGLAFTNTAVYNSYTNALIADFGVQLDLVEFSNRTDFYIYNKQSKSILKIEPTAAPPVINSVSPNTGLVKGGTVVNITGTGFTGATEVYFDNNLGTNLKVNSDTSITVTSPIASNIGTADIVIVGPNGTNVISNSDRFTYTGLTVNVTATNGSIAGLLQGYNYGATVTLTASATEGYTFRNWTDKLGNVLSTNQVYNFTIKDNVDINANFIDNCDINSDGKVDILDLASVAKNYNMKSTNTNWISRYDFNKDGIIDIYDLVLCSKRATK